MDHKNKHHIKYPDVPSAIKPVPHGPGIPIPTPPQAYTGLLLDSDDEMVDEDISVTYQHLVESHQPKPFSKAKLNDRTRDLGFSKEFVQLLRSRLSKNNLLSAETTFRSREEDNILVPTKKIGWFTVITSVVSLLQWVLLMILQNVGSSSTPQTEA